VCVCVCCVNGGGSQGVSSELLNKGGLGKAKNVINDKLAKFKKNASKRFA
jgi:hypothetical protein